MGQGYTETGEKKKEKKRRERSAKQWILEGALFFHFSPSSPFLSLSLSRFFSRSFFPFRKTTATSWQTGRYVPVRSALTSPFLSNLICRERRCYRRASPTFHLASNYRRWILDNSPCPQPPSACALYTRQKYSSFKYFLDDSRQGIIGSSITQIFLYLIFLSYCF